MAQYFSFRVPWHDNNWNGNICSFPQENHSCMRLKGINQAKNEKRESDNADACMSTCPFTNEIPCIREGAAFMSPEDITVTIEHPYVSWSKYHKHLLPLKETIPSFSYPARPFRWLMRKRRGDGNTIIDISQLAKEEGFDFQSEFEPEMENKTWVQDGRNQIAVIKSFFKDAVPNESLCVFYAKQVPFIEDTRRVVIGIGHIKGVQPPMKYPMADENGMTSVAWENMVSHSIRKDLNDGFLLPYNELIEYSKEHEDFDIRNATIFAADDYFNEFSYASEHLSHDAVIDVIIQCLKVIELYKRCRIPGDWNHVTEWLNEQLNKAWKDRGAYPGLGAMLSAFGIESGPVIAREINSKKNSSDAIWKILDDSINNPTSLPKMCSDEINGTVIAAWNNMGNERKALFKLLSRITLSIEQAKVVFRPEKRKEFEIELTDHEILKNPYLLYERTRDKAGELKISIKKVDLALYPPSFIEDNNPLDIPSKMDSVLDQRRVRALLISSLENEALNGHTIMPVYNAISSICALDIQPKCEITADIIAGMKEFLSAEIETKKDEQKNDYYKLLRYKSIDYLISAQIEKRVKSPNRHKLDVDWDAVVNAECDKFTKNPNIDFENNARKEKACALKMLAEARLSVLVGGAGTGKTTVLDILCNQPDIQNGGILLLAPTGKARVRMTNGLTNSKAFHAQTIAQFLLQSKRFDFDNYTYRILSSSQRQAVRGPAVPKTVIIDESSMLTEDMFGALLDAISSAERIIFVGDVSQLPPIGAGRPFVDMVEYIKSQDNITKFPKIGRSYAELTITNRQLPNEKTNEIRSDVRLMNWFTADNQQCDEEIFAELQAGTKDGKVVFKQWTNKEDLEALILDAIKDITGMSDIDDIDGFNLSLGGEVEHGGKYDRYTVFKVSSNGHAGSAEKAEKWQILSPVKNDAQGVLNINHLVHEKYKSKTLLAAEKNRMIPKKMGADSIVYGDKVINVINQKREAYPNGVGNDYVANGEIGIASCKFGSKKYLDVEYASQMNFSYSYSEDHDFNDEGANPLELAYALTVHKTQGSQFDSVILVLSDKSSLISKEMLYTALTRQKKQLIILYDQEAYNLKKYSSNKYSVIAQRYTDLFRTPNIVKVEDKYYEENLIHRTKNGIMVRSKSEVIIANMLVDNGIDGFLYEEKLQLGSEYKLPDFTFKDAASGTVIIWEHLGMLGDSGYRRSWDAKKKLYEEFGFSEDNGNLIVTQDSLNGAIDSQEIQAKIEKYLK